MFVVYMLLLNSLMFNPSVTVTMSKILLIPLYSIELLNVINHNEEQNLSLVNLLESV